MKGIGREGKGKEGKVWRGQRREREGEMTPYIPLNVVHADLRMEHEGKVL